VEVHFHFSLRLHDSHKDTFSSLSPKFSFRLEADDRSRIMFLLHSNLLLLKITAGQYAAHGDEFAAFLHRNSFSNEI